MTTPIPTPPPIKRSDLPHKLALLFLMVISTGLGIAILFRDGYPLAYLFMIFFDSALLGLVTGLGARFILKNRGVGLSLLATLAALTTGLFVLGISTSWKYGLGPLTFKPGHFDWSGLIQMVNGVLTATMSMFAWRQPTQFTAPIQDLEPSLPEPVNIGIQVLSTQPEQVKVQKTHSANSGKKQELMTGSRPIERTKSRNTSKSKADTIPVKPASSKPKRRLLKPDVQFSTNVEFRCPYCLDPVLTDDPRGIVECKICHTLHHADCWAITGFCQVPHQNT